VTATLDSRAAVTLVSLESLHRLVGLDLVARAGRARWRAGFENNTDDFNHGCAYTQLAWQKNAAEGYPSQKLNREPVG
jgi:hypothetical protein